MKAITVERYKEIRNRSTFLYEYFTETTGTSIPLVAFENTLAIWMQAMGAHPQHGVTMITQYLDNKHK